MKVAYRGYTITRSPFDGMYRVERDGVLIYSATSEADAKTTINELVGAR